MFRLWFLLLLEAFCIFDASGQSTGEYRIYHPKTRLGFKAIDTGLFLAPNSSKWILKEYLSGGYQIQHASSGRVLTKLYDGHKPTVGILPIAERQKPNQRWFLTPDGSVVTADEPRLYLETGKDGTFHLAPRLNSVKQKFLFKQMRNYGIYGEEMDLMEMYTPLKAITEEIKPSFESSLTTEKPKPTTNSPKPTTTRRKRLGFSSGEFYIMKRDSNQGLENVGGKVKLTATPSVWILKEYRSKDFVIQDARTGDVFTNTALPEVLIRPRSDNRKQRNQRWFVSPEGRIVTADNSWLTVEYSPEDGRVTLSENSVSPHQIFHFKQLKDYGIFGEEIDAREDSSVKPTEETYVGTTPDPITTFKVRTTTTKPTTTRRTATTWAKTRRTRRPKYTLTSRPRFKTTRRPKPRTTMRPKTRSTTKRRKPKYPTEWFRTKPTKPRTKYPVKWPRTKPYTRRPRTKPYTRRPRTKPKTKRPRTKPKTKRPRTRLTTKKPRNKHIKTRRPRTKRPKAKRDPNISDPTTSGNKNRKPRPNSDRDESHYDC